MSKTKLSPKQAQFVDEYLVDFNATQAAIRAGYSKKSARMQACRLLTKDNIQEGIRVRQKQLRESTRITPEKVIAELAKVGFATMASYMSVGKDGYPVLDFSELSEDQAAALSEVTVDTYMHGRGEDGQEILKAKFKLHDKLRALEMIGKHLGLFTDRVELSGPDGSPIPMSLEIEFVDPDESSDTE